MRLQHSVFLVLSVCLVGCAHNNTTVIVDRKIDSAKVVALDAPRTPWVVEIETRLRQSGFQVLRWPSQRRVREQVSEARTEEFRQAAARYVLVIDGQAPLDTANRCFVAVIALTFLPLNSSTRKPTRQCSA